MQDKWGRWRYTPFEQGEKIRIVFLFQAASVWASWETFYKACMEDPEIEVKILLLTESTIEKAQMFSAGEFLKKEDIPYEKFENFDIDGYEPHIAFIQFPYDLSYHAPEALSLRLRGKGIRIAYIPYGIEISDEPNARRDHFENFVVENSWRIFTCCETIKNDYQKYCRSREAVRVCGSPKFDGIRYKERYPLSTEIVRKSKGRKIIVWKMHFPKKNNVNGKTVLITPEPDEYIEFAKNMGEHDDLFFIVMAHPKMLHGMVNSDTKGDGSLTDKARKLIQIIKKYENVCLDMSDDYRNSLYHADAIIMDRSAVVIEAAMTGKPVLMMQNADYKERWTDGVKQVAETFTQGCTATDMEHFINDVRHTKGKGQSETQAALDTYFPYYDGACGYRIKELIKREIKEEAESTNEKPKVILYGAGDVCRYYLEEKHFAENSEIEVKAIVDGNSSRWGEYFCGCKIASPEELLQKKFDVLVIMTEQNYFEIKKWLVYGMFIDERKIWRLDEFLCEVGKCL